MAKLKRYRTGKKLQKGDKAPEVDNSQFTVEEYTPELSSDDFTTHGGELSLEEYSKLLQKDKTISQREKKRRIRKASRIFENIPNTRVIVDKTKGKTQWKWEDPTADTERQGGVSDIQEKGIFGGKGFAGLVGGEFEDTLQDMISRGAVKYDKATRKVKKPVEKSKEYTTGDDVLDKQIDKNVDSGVNEEVRKIGNTGGDEPGMQNEKTDVDNRDEGSKVDAKLAKESVEDNYDAQEENRKLGLEDPEEERAEVYEGDFDLNVYDLDKSLSGRIKGGHEDALNQGYVSTYYDKDNNQLYAIDRFGYVYKREEDPFFETGKNYEFNKVDALPSNALKVGVTVPEVGKITNVNRNARNEIVGINEQGRVFQYNFEEGTWEFNPMRQDKTNKDILSRPSNYVVNDKNEVLSLDEHGRPIKLQSTPNDPQGAKAWGYDNVTQEDFDLLDATFKKRQENPPVAASTTDTPTTESSTISMETNVNEISPEMSLPEPSEPLALDDKGQPILKGMGVAWTERELEEVISEPPEGYTPEQYRNYLIKRSNQLKASLKRKGGVLYRSGGRLPRYFLGGLMSSLAPALGNIAGSLFQGKGNENQAPVGGAPTGQQPGQTIQLDVPLEIINQAISNMGSGAGSSIGGAIGGVLQGLGQGVGQMNVGEIASQENGGKMKFQMPAQGIPESPDYTYGFPLKLRSGVPAFNYSIPVNYPKSTFRVNPNASPGVSSLKPREDSLQTAMNYAQERPPVNQPTNKETGNVHTFDPQHRGIRGILGNQNRNQRIYPGLKPIVQYIFTKPQSVEVPRKPLLNFNPGMQSVESGLNPDIARMAMKRFDDMSGRYREGVDPVVNAIRALSTDQARSQLASNIAEADIQKRSRTKQLARRDAEANRQMQENVRMQNVATTYENELAESEADLNRRLAEQRRVGDLAGGLIDSVTGRRQQALAFKNYINQQAYQTGLQSRKADSAAAFQRYQDIAERIMKDPANKDQTISDLRENNPELRAAWSNYLKARGAIDEYRQSNQDDMTKEFYKDINYGTVGRLFSKKGGKLKMRRGGGFAGPAAASIRAKGFKDVAKIRQEIARKDRKLRKDALNLQRERMIRRLNALYFNKLKMRS